MEMTAEMSDAELHQATIDMNAEDIIEHARDFFACFDGLTEFKVVLLDNGVVQIQLPKDYVSEFETEFSL